MTLRHRTRFAFVRFHDCAVSGGSRFVLGGPPRPPSNDAYSFLFSSSVLMVVQLQDATWRPASHVIYPAVNTGVR